MSVQVPAFSPSGYVQKRNCWRMSGQVGGIDRYTLLPHTTKRRTTTSLKTKNNQNCQKIELYGSLTTRNLKKCSSRLIGGTETGSQGGDGLGRRGCGWWMGQTRSHTRVWINWEKQLGSETDHTTQGSKAQGNKASKPVAVNASGGCGSRRNSQTHRRDCWRGPLGPRMYTNPPTWESAPEGLNLLVGSR